MVYHGPLLSDQRALPSESRRRQSSNGGRSHVLNVAERFGRRANFSRDLVSIDADAHEMKVSEAGDISPRSSKQAGDARHPRVCSYQHGCVELQFSKSNDASPCACGAESSRMAKQALPATTYDTMDFRNLTCLQLEKKDVESSKAPEMREATVTFSLRWQSHQQTTDLVRGSGVQQRAWNETNEALWCRRKWSFSIPRREVAPIPTTDSVRGEPALVCWECNSNPWHRKCDKDSKYVEVCPTCNQMSVKVFTGVSAATAAPSDIVDLTGEEVLRRWLPRSQRMGLGRTLCPRSSAAWSRQMWRGGVHGGGKQVQAAASAARAGSLQGQRPARRLRARAWGRQRELALLAAAARARSALANAPTGLEWKAAGRAAAGGTGKGGPGTLVAQEAGGRRRGKEERAAISGRRQMQTRERAAGAASEHEGGGRGNASTIG